MLAAVPPSAAAGKSEGNGSPHENLHAGVHVMSHRRGGLLVHRRGLGLADRPADHPAGLRHVDGVRYAVFGKRLAAAARGRIENLNLIRKPVRRFFVLFASET